MKSILSLLIMIVFTVTACTKGGEPEAVAGDSYAVTSAATSKQLIPAIDTTSTATFFGYYDDEANVLTFTLTWNDLWRDTNKDTVTAIAFYGPASPTTSGMLVRSMPVVNTNKAGSMNLGLSGSTGFLANEKADFIAGRYYFTINTKRYPAGIVRGQLSLMKK